MGFVFVLLESETIEIAGIGFRRVQLHRNHKNKSRFGHETN